METKKESPAREQGLNIKNRLHKCTANLKVINGILDIFSRTFKIKSFELDEWKSLHDLSVDELEASINRCKRKLEGIEHTFLLRTIIEEAFAQYSLELYSRGKNKLNPHKKHLLS